MNKPPIPTIVTSDLDGPKKYIMETGFNYSVSLYRNNKTNYYLFVGEDSLGNYIFDNEPVKQGSLYPIVGSTMEKTTLTGYNMFSYNGPGFDQTKDILNWNDLEQGYYLQSNKEKTYKTQVPIVVLTASENFEIIKVLDLELEFYGYCNNKGEVGKKELEDNFLYHTIFFITSENANQDADRLNISQL